MSGNARIDEDVRGPKENDAPVAGSIKDENPMRRPILAKVVVNIGIGEPGEKVSRAVTLLESLTGQKPVRTTAKKTNRDLNVRKNDLIGCKVTLRKKRAEVFLKKALEVTERMIMAKSFDNEGNLAFGIAEHINIPGVRYDPSVGIYGMDVCVSVERKGYRIKRRKLQKRKIPRTHRVEKVDAMKFIQERYDVRVV